MISEFFKKRKVNKAWLEAIVEDKFHKRYAAEKKRIKDVTVKMLSAPCAINNNLHCNRACVHFRAGNMKSYEWCDSLYIDSCDPKCKLWK